MKRFVLVPLSQPSSGSFSVVMTGGRVLPTKLMPPILFRLERSEYHVQIIHERVCRAWLSEVFDRKLSAQVEVQQGETAAFKQPHHLAWCIGAVQMLFVTIWNIDVDVLKARLASGDKCAKDCLHGCDLIFAGVFLGPSSSHVWIICHESSASDRTLLILSRATLAVFLQNLMKRSGWVMMKVLPP